MQEFGHVWRACFGLSEDTGCHHRACSCSAGVQRGLLTPLKGREADPTHLFCSTSLLGRGRKGRADSRGLGFSEENQRQVPGGWLGSIKKKSDIPTPNLMCLYPEILPQIWDFRCTRTLGLELTWILLSRHRTTNKNPNILLSLFTHQKTPPNRCESVEGAI